MNAPPAALLDSRYRLGAVIARGGMSTVYRGVDTRLDRPVAIKVMDSQLAADPAFRTRFEREARSAARIDHPAVVDVYDQGEASGPDGPVTFLVMELVEGGTLRDLLRARGAIGVPAAVAVMEPVLQGLAQAHRLGLVHRDVKPENVLISGHGEVKVADFGLVTAAARAGVSHAGMILGTVAYLSPEQVETGAADARSDVYAAGVLLYELLVGEPPYTGDTAISVAYRHVNSDVPAPSASAADVPPELDELVARATRRDPAGRPADAAALLEELRRVVRQLGVPRVDVPVPPAQASAEPDTTPAALGPGRVDAAGRPPAAGAAVGPGGTRALPRPPAAPAVAAQPPHLHDRRRSRRVFAAGVVLVTVLALLVGTAAWWLGSGRWTEMPNVVGLSETNARQLLSAADLVATSAPGGDGQAPAGTVTASDQAGGARLLRGSSVALTVSTGRPTVPAIPAGTSRAQAERLLAAAGLDSEVDRDEAEYSDTVAEDAVLRTAPAAGTAVDRGTSVHLVLSNGPRSGSDSHTVRLPDVVGKGYQDAREQLQDLGLDVERESRPGFGGDRDGRLRDRLDRVAPVIQQSPAAGTEVDRDSTVTLSTAF